ncbi:MAG: restriction endonuclease subunit S [Bacilli bacterium]|nr:restriction endonuclease subunit S [Bacilli bacterium]
MTEPKIRFKNDDGNNYPNLKKLLISDVMVERHELKTLSKDLPQLSFTIEEGVINPEDKKTNKRDFLIKDKSSKKFAVTELDDIIYNPANIKFGAIHRNKLGRGGVSPIYAIFKPLVNSTYLELYVQRKKFISKAMRYLEGSVVKLMSLKPDDFLKLEINLPCEEEQNKISNFITEIDTIILESEQELKYLLSQKKGVMQKLFNQSIRFKDDSGNEYPKWEKRKLLEVGSFLRGGTLSKEDISGTETPCVLYGHLYTEYGEKIDKVKFYTNNKSNTFAKKNDVLFPTSTTADAESLISPSSVEIYEIAVGGDIIVFRPNEEIIGAYLSYIINNALRKQFAIYAQGSTIIHIQSKNLGPRLISIPCIEEQRKIVDLLSLYDEAIVNSKQEIEKYKDLKKGLLQQMFI